MSKVHFLKNEPNSCRRYSVKVVPVAVETDELLCTYARDDMCSRATWHGCCVWLNDGSLSDDVCLCVVIGKGGEQIASIQSESECKIQFAPGLCLTVCVCVVNASLTHDSAAVSVSRDCRQCCFLLFDVLTRSLYKSALLSLTRRQPWHIVQTLTVRLHDTYSLDTFT